MGARKTPNVSAILIVFPMSLNTRLIMEEINPVPKAINIMKNRIKGINNIFQEGTTPYHIITTVTGISLIRKSNMACPMEATTRDSFGKLIFVTRLPAFTRLLVAPARHVENNCQTEMLQRACMT